MGHKSKTPKGEIGISNCKGRIRLRWRFSGERYSFSLPFAYLPENLHHATIKAAEIKLDIMKGCFDTSLKKYYAASTPPKLKVVISAMPAPESKELSMIGQLVEHFNNWGKNYRNADIDSSIQYLYVRKFLEKWPGTPITKLAAKLNAENWATRTYNDRLTLLKPFFSWLLDTGVIGMHPLKEVRRKKNKGNRKNPRRTPMEEVEIIALLVAIKNDTYCPAASRFKHSNYYPFLSFIFFTGVRNAEAIGLKVSHINFSDRKVEISEAFARTVRGSHHSARVAKGTKTGNVRYLPLPDELYKLLVQQVEGKKPDDLVFTSPKGLSIDDRMLERRVLKPVLIKLGFGDRDLYSARHTFGTRAVQQGMPLTEIAYLMGHSTAETALRNYVSVSRPALKLPVIAVME
jgi:integrase